jgi:hypothetical protein
MPQQKRPRQKTYVVGGERALGLVLVLFASRALGRVGLFGRRLGGSDCCFFLCHDVHWWGGEQSGKMGA